jgi:HEAT repeat protein
MHLRLAGSALMLLALAGLAQAQGRGPARRPGKPAERPSTSKSRPGPSAGSNLSTSSKQIGGKTLAEWEKELMNSDPSRRSAALVMLPHFGKEASHAVPLVLKRCEDRDTSPRVKAVIVLRTMHVERNQVPAVVKALARRLAYPPEAQSIVKYEAVVSLSHFGDDAQAAIPALMTAAKDTSSWEIRHGAISVLWRAAQASKENSSKEVYDVYRTLMAALRDPTRQVRLEAIQGLGGLGRPANTALALQVIKALYLQTTTGSSKVLAIWAYASLVALYGNSEVKAGDKQILFLAKFLSKKHALETRVNALQALAALHARARIVQDKVLALLKDSQPLIVHAAAGALVGMGDTNAKVINGFIDLLGHKDPNCVFSGCLALTTIKVGNKAVLAALDKQLNRKDITPELKKLYKDTIDELKKPKK